MTRPYSNDLRERVVRAHLDGEPIRSVAARFGVSVSSVPKWVARYRATGSVAPGRVGGHRPRLLEPHRERVHALVAATPHLTLDRLHSQLGLGALDDVLSHRVAGASWEGLVIDNLIAAAPFGTDAWFYRTRAGAEIDLLLQLPDRRQRAVADLAGGTRGGGDHGLTPGHEPSDFIEVRRLIPIARSNVWKSGPGQTVLPCRLGGRWSSGGCRRARLRPADRATPHDEHTPVAYL